MKPHIIEIKNPETNTSIIIDMEGPYHKKMKKIGEQSNCYGSCYSWHAVILQDSYIIAINRRIIRLQQKLLRLSALKSNLC